MESTYKRKTHIFHTTGDTVKSYDLMEFNNITF